MALGGRRMGGFLESSGQENIKVKSGDKCAHPYYEMFTFGDAELITTPQGLIINITGTQGVDIPVAPGLYILVRGINVEIELINDNSTIEARIVFELGDEITLKFVVGDNTLFEHVLRSMYWVEIGLIDDKTVRILADNSVFMYECENKINQYTVKSIGTDRGTMWYVGAYSYSG